MVTASWKSPCRPANSPRSCIRIPDDRIRPIEPNNGPAMKALARPLLLAVLACALAACDTPDTVMENGAIMLYGNQVTLRVAGSPKATIDAEGAFAVDGKTVATTPAQRDLLAQYNRSVRSVHDTGVAMGKAGGKMALKSIKAELSSTPDEANDAAEAGGDRMRKLALDICKAETSIKTVQDQLATQLAAFKPYASIVDASDARDCESDAKD
ncbi:MAG: YggN family protein [Rhodanobacter sp.]